MSELVRAALRNQPDLSALICGCTSTRVISTKTDLSVSICENAQPIIMIRSTVKVLLQTFPCNLIAIDLEHHTSSRFVKLRSNIVRLHGDIIKSLALSLIAQPGSKPIQRVVPQSEVCIPLTDLVSSYAVSKPRKGILSGSSPRRRKDLALIVSSNTGEQRQSHDTLDKTRQSPRSPRAQYG